MLLSNPKSDYSSTRRMPSVKLLPGQIQATTTTANTMPTSTSLQDINSQTQKFHWNKEQPLLNLSESLLTSKNANHHRQRKVSQSDDHIFEHPEVTIKPNSIDDRIQRRLLTSTQPFNSHINGGGSVPNILEHPDMRTPIVMTTQQLSPSSSSTSSSSERRKLIRQQSADVYSTLARAASPTNQTHSASKPLRSNSPGSFIGDIVESPEHEKSDDTSTSTATPPPVPTSKAPTQIIREYSETSSISDVDRRNKTQPNVNKAQSEEDDFW